MKLDILAIGVHPDDVELGCGGTILKQIALGYKVGIVDLTQGELGTNGTAKTRKKEAESAKNFAGVLIRDNLKMADGFFENSKANKLKLIKAIRQYQPDIVLANAITDRHPDHGRASLMIKEACFLSGLVKIETKLGKKKQEKWRPRKVFNFIQDHHLEPDVVVDISDFIKEKIKFVQCYETQFHNAKRKNKSTPISSKSFLESLTGRAIAHGRRIGVEYGEGYTCEEYIGTQDLMKIL
jgi:bacillithiol biosynthesis deacetylase BshB1